MYKILDKLVTDFSKKIKPGTKKTKLDIYELENGLVKKLGKKDFNILGGYAKFAESVEVLIEQNKLQPVKKSGSNGKNPALYNKYWLLINQELRKQVKKELLLFQHLDNASFFYETYPEKFQEDKEYLVLLNDFLKNDQASNKRITLNQRSYQIFKDEKFLQDKDRGKPYLLKLIKNPREKLNYYEENDPVYLFPLTSKLNKLSSVLIVENKNVFRSLHEDTDFRKTLIKDFSIYGLGCGYGRKITGNFDFIKEIPFIDKATTRIYYIGDLDPEGISIAVYIIKEYPEYDIKPMTSLYERMIKKEPDPPYLKEDQSCSKEQLAYFLGFFDVDLRKKIRQVIEEGKYIPEEVLCL
ncbi:DUF2399 domain-containing protein [Natranaerofaba carboxydovora]|uniref:DUF2399 domain-containing protein n=1 Tax=Natranaerofaba carboxydovora TaxID=2742683 RepID=UPI001F13B784|nr:DUF2399 domain-containing protein [Natranaerofaba carboxydovora]UMZ74677.1 hypothetical protein ACONDI_02277 [Natranaerofaba carboxydovora]